MNGLIIPFCIYCKALYNCVLKDFHYCWHYSTHNLVTTSFWLFTHFGNLMSLDFDSDVKKMQVFRLIKRGWHETFCILLKNCTDWPSEGALIKCHNDNTNVTGILLNFWQNKDKLYSLCSDFADIPQIGNTGML